MPGAQPGPVRLEGITKSYPGGLVACRAVDLDLYPGEIHALVGENGAGKTTLMNVLFGLAVPDEGRIVIDGRTVLHRSPADAIANGVGMVHQHFKLVGSFTVAENLTLAGIGRSGLWAAKLVNSAIISRLAERYGLDVSANSVVGRLPLSVQQRVEILKALYHDVRILILDEPSAILNPKEIERLYETLLRVAREGRIVVLVTHHMQEVFAFSDRVSIMRHGKLVGSAPTSEMTRDQVARLIVGRKFEAHKPFQRAADAPLGGEILRFSGVSGGGERHSTGLDNVSFGVRSGEVVAIAGVEGNGQRALFELATALRQPDSGRIEIGIDRFGARSRAESMGLGVRLVPEDRHQDGLVLDLTVSENLLLDCAHNRPYATCWRLNLDQIAESSRDLLTKFNIRATDIHVRARTLSGGNQQKVVLARAMRDGAPILVTYQPTRGLDIGATEELLERLRGAANEGAAVLLISSNLDEILRVADRIIVLYRGRVMGEVGGEDASLDKIGGWMTGAEVA